MSHWTAPAFLTTLETRLGARAGLSNVKVFIAPPGDNMPKTDAIWVTSIATTEEWAALAADTRPRHEDYNIECSLSVVKPGGGKTVWTATLDRAGAILAEIEDELTEHAATIANLIITATGCQFFVAELSSYETTQGALPGDRGVRIDFTLHCQARKP